MCIRDSAVAARELDRACRFAQKHGFEKAYGSYDEMLEDGEVDLVYIATPHSHHYEHIKKCLAHGKDVYKRQGGGLSEHDCSPELCG